MRRNKPERLPFLPFQKEGDSLPSPKASAWKPALKQNINLMNHFPGMEITWTCEICFSCQNNFQFHRWQEKGSPQISPPPQKPLSEKPSPASSWPKESKEPVP